MSSAYTLESYFTCELSPIPSRFGRKEGVFPGGMVGESPRTNLRRENNCANTAGFVLHEDNGESIDVHFRESVRVIIRSRV